MTDAATSDATRYLLGRMSDEERDAFELRVLADAELSELVASVEADLLDAYVRGELRGEERERVERHLTATPAQKQRLAAAQVLRESLARRTARSRRAWWPAAAAAALAVVIGAAILVPRRAVRPGPVKPIVSKPMTQPTLTTTEPVVVPNVEPRQPVVVTFALASMTTRSDGRPQVLTIPADAELVRLDLGLQSGDEGFASYRAVVQTVSGREIARREKLSVSEGVVRIEMPAARLARGDYEVLVDGVPASGEAEPLGAWAFAVAR